MVYISLVPFKVNSPPPLTCSSISKELMVGPTGSADFRVTLIYARSGWESSGRWITTALASTKV